MRTLPIHDHKRIDTAFQDLVAHAYKCSETGCDPVLPFTLQVTEDCNLRCTYCYQINKSKHRMSLETAKKAIDVILTDHDYISSAAAVELDFIGGEPLLEIDLIRDAYEYFLKRCIELQHPWLMRHMVSLCSNGVLYFDPRVQDFLKRYRQSISFSISVDGTRELHNACRLFPDGTGSYDAAMCAVKHFQAHYGEPGSKITIAPANVRYLFSAITHMIEEGYHSVVSNCVFEKGWTVEHARELYRQLVRLADYFYEHDLYADDCTTLFEEQAFCPVDYAQDDKNWCGGTGKMLAVDWRGIFYPCLRYMPSSLGAARKPLVVGTVERGLCKTQEEKCLRCRLDGITATSQSTEECIRCPIRAGCAWCSAYNYQETGDVNKRVTYICVMHKARALANAYYWNRFYEKHKVNAYYKNYVPEAWAVPIIGRKAWKELCAIEAAQKERSEAHGMHELR